MPRMSEGKLTAEQIARTARLLKEQAVGTSVWIDGVEYVGINGPPCALCKVYVGTERPLGLPFYICMACVPRLRAELKRLVRRDQRERERAPRPQRPD